MKGTSKYANICLGAQWSPVPFAERLLVWLTSVHLNYDGTHHIKQ
jgi:hypothetical protein